MAKHLDTTYLIVGAGLTGLTLGYYLRKAGRDVVIVEKSDRTGGVIRTISEAGFTLEAGPNTGVMSTPEIAELFEDLDDRVSLATPDNTAKVRWILKKGRWHALPSGLIPAIKTPLFSRRDKLGILGEPFRARGKDPDESVADLVRRRLGQSYLDYAVDPFISGIYAGDPERLITRHALPKLYRLEQEYGSFIRGAIKKQFEKKDPREAKATREVFSARGGLQSLTDALTGSIGKENIICGCSKIMISLDDKKYTTRINCADGEEISIQSSHVITTIGGYALNEVLDFISEEQLQTLTKLEYARVVQLAAGYKHWDGIPLTAFGGLIPSEENKQALGILFPSAIFNDRAPEGGALLSIFFGGMKKSHFIDKDDEEIKNIALKEIGETLQVRNNTPDLLKIFRYEHAIPQYERSSQERLEAIDLLQKRYPGLILAGNVRDGIGMADRVRQARTISEQLIAKDE